MRACVRVCVQSPRASKLECPWILVFVLNSVYLYVVLYLFIRCI